MHIAFNVDHEHVRFCGVAIMSALRCNRNRNTRVVAHVLSRGLTAHDRATLNALAALYGGEVFFYEPDTRLIEGFRVADARRQVPLVTYFRCLLAEYLPTTLHRVIYLDCDTIVCNRLDGFWNLPLAGAPLAAVADVAATSARYDALGYGPEEGYFNAGVLLVNLDYWREHNVGQACIDSFQSLPAGVVLNDQELLNRVFHGEVVWASMRFNAQSGFYRTSYPYYDEHRKELDRPAILHFSQSKPWEWNCMHPLRHAFFSCQNLTPWRGENVLSNPFVRFARWVRLLPYTLHVCRRRYRDDVNFYV